MVNFVKLGLTGLAAAAVSVPVIAQGQESAEPAPSASAPQKRGKMSLAVPDLPDPVERTLRRHEGFYLRTSIGIAALRGSLSGGANASEDATTGGAGANVSVLVGGAPDAGFALGVGAQYTLQLSGDWDSDGAGDASSELNTLIVGPFVDGHPDPQGSWHFGGTVGLAQASIGYGSLDDSALGVGGGAWMGHDSWVADEWSMGGMLRFDALRAWGDDDVAVTTLLFSLQLTALMH